MAQREKFNFLKSIFFICAKEYLTIGASALFLDSIVEHLQLL